MSTNLKILIVVTAILLPIAAVAQSPDTLKSPGGPFEASAFTVRPPGITVDINTADEASLIEELGLAPAEAKAILSYRQQHGPLKNLAELKRVRGLSSGSYEEIKDNVQFSFEASTERAASEPVLVR